MSNNQPDALVKDMAEWIISTLRWSACRGDHERDGERLIKRYRSIVSSQAKHDNCNHSEKLNSSSENETYPQPEHGWTCFHCGETFMTPGAAKDHFGTYPWATPGCIERVRCGAERGLLMSLREAEDRISEYMNEASGVYRDACSSQARVSEKLQRAEELGYERGLRDARKTEDWSACIAVLQQCSKAMNAASAHIDGDHDEEYERLESAIVATEDLLAKVGCVASENGLEGAE